MVAKLYVYKFIGLGGWGSAFYQVLLEDDRKGLIDYYGDEENDYFSSFSSERQSEYRQRMVEAVRRNRRVIMYKKWLYAKERLIKDAEASAKEKEVSWSSLPPLRFEASTKEKEVSWDMEQPLTIWLFVHHGLLKLEHALYKIQLPLDLSDYDQMIDSDGFMTDSKNISPVLTFKELNFMPSCASVTLGSSIYFFGGYHDFVKDKRLYCKVQVFDTEHPEQGMRTVSPLNRPKKCPCVFVADGMIYALGSYLGKPWREREIPSGFFERYDPSLDQWKVLSDPPLENTEWGMAHFLDRATVVGRRVFIGSPYLYVIFNLDDQDWEQVPPVLGRRFYCAASFVPASASLYCLSHPQSYDDPVKVFKRGPLTTIGTTEQSDYVKNLLNSPCLDFDKEQVVAEGTDLEDVFFAHCDFDPHRMLVYMGDRFFCYVVSAQLADDTHTVPEPEPTPRGVWINILEEVPAAETDDGDSKAKFRTLASFCYKINNNFNNRACYIRCSVLGTVPDSWIKAPLEKKLSIKLKCKSKKSKALLFGSLFTPTEQEEEWRHELENARKKLLTVEDENRRLVVELAKKERLLKKYQSLSLSMVNVNSESEKEEEIRS